MCVRTILCVSGPDAKSFLQNLVTNDVTKLNNNIIYSALLTPQGKLVADFFLIDSGQDILIDVNAEVSNTLLKLLSLYKLRAEIGIEKTDLKVSTGIKNKPQKGFMDPRHPQMGWRHYSNDDLSERNIDWGKLRIENLIPEFGKELSKDSYILEYGFESLNGVDFKKGCYVGQENTARIKLKNKLSKRLFPINVIKGELTEGESIYYNENEIGKVLIDKDYPFALIKYLDENFNGNSDFNTKEASIKIEKPDWIKN
jgi:folate-binding protein YgfZ